MGRILSINAGKAYAHSKGQLNATLHELAVGELSELGHDVVTTCLEDGYDVQQEVERFLWADAIIYQMPGWWMGAPWTLKRYIDEVFTHGHGKLYASDGRSRHDASKRYGSGGLLQGRRYMLSLTWNAPRMAFEDPEDFFEGRGVDGVYFPFHKAQQFLGLEALPTFLATDVIKNPDIELYQREYRAHLRELFGRTR